MQLQQYYLLHRITRFNTLKKTMFYLRKPVYEFYAINDSAVIAVLRRSILNVLP